MKLVLIAILLICQIYGAKVFVFNSTNCEGVFTHAEVHPNGDCFRNPDGSFTKYDCVNNQVQICSTNTPQCATCSNTQTFNQNQCYNGKRFFCDDLLPNTNGAIVYNFTNGPCNAPSSRHLEIRPPFCRPTEDGSAFQTMLCLNDKKVIRVCSDRDCKRDCREVASPLARCVNIRGFNATERCLPAPPPAQLRPCFMADIDNAIRTMTSLLNSTSLNDASIDTIRQRFEQLMGDRLSACMDLINRFITGFRETNIPIISTECTVEYNSEEWRNDPCCNPALLLNACCAPRMITKTVRIPVLAPVNCTNTDRIRGMFFSYYNLLYNQKPAPESEEAKASKNIPECVNFVMRGNIPCTADTDCVFSQSCRPTGFCRVPNTPNEFYTAFAKCILEDASAPAGNAVNNLGRALIARKLNAPMTVNAFRDAMTTVFNNSGSCYRLNNNGQVDPLLLNSRSACEGQNVRCNDPEFVVGDNCNNAPANQFFCGDCGLESSCLRAPANQSQCSQLVVCRRGNEGIFLTLRDNCESRMSCNIRPDVYRTAAACTQAGDCSISPGKDAVCLLRNERNAGTCLGLTNLNVQCQMTISGYCACTHFRNDTAPLSTLCNNRNGQYVVLNSQQACEGIDRVCVVGMIRRPLNATECSKCQGVPIPVYQWKTGQFLQNTVVRSASWLAVGPIRAYQWVTPGFDVQRFRNWVSEAIGDVYSKFIASQARRIYLSQLEFVRKFACDCGADKRNNCFDEPVKVAIGVVNAVPGTVQRYEFPEANVTMKANSFAPSRGAAVSVDVNQASLDIDQSSSTRSRLQTSTFNVVDRSTSRTIGAVVGNGVSLNTQPDGPVSLCLPLDSRITTTYTRPAFAVLDNGVYRSTSVSVTISGDAYCADVSDTQTYYPAKLEVVTPAATPVTPVTPVASKKLSSAAVASLSALVLLILALLF